MDVDGFEVWISLARIAQDIGLAAFYHRGVGVIAGDGEAHANHLLGLRPPYAAHHFHIPLTQQLNGSAVEGHHPFQLFHNQFNGFILVKGTGHDGASLAQCFGLLGALAGFFK